MHRGLAVAVAAVVVIGGAAFWLHRPRPEPKEVVTSAPDASRIAPRKADPPAPVTTVVPKKNESANRADPPAPPPVPAPPAAPKLASLQLESDVPGASVFIDRQFVGNTPLTLNDLQPGSKRVQLTATGYDSIQKTIELNPGPNAVTVRIKEVTLNARTEVVHKHGVGSCEGSLVATLDGLQYLSSNQGDAFNLPYPQVETFVVDYLQKNLRLKQKGGKTWNFTDKNDNADKLFVFHRDVEAARKKLAEGYARAQD